jgi:transposase
MGYYCGIDLGNKETVICIIEGRRQVVAEERMATEAKALRKVLGKYRGLTCLVEAAPLAEWICTEVEKLGHKISIVCPRKAKVALSSQGKGKKTDERDAHALAELCRSGWYEAVHRKSEEAREVRSFMTARRQLVECGSAIASSIRGILRAHGIKLTCGTDESSFNEKVQSAAKKLPPLAREGIEELLKAFEQLYEQQRSLYKKLRKQSWDDESMKRLQSIPGVGPATAAAFVATIDDPDRFPGPEKVAAYLGLTPSVYQSGETEYRGRITKTGDKLLRWLLVEAAHILLSRSGTPCELRTWGLRLQKSKGVGKARVAVARRLCGIMWKLWKDGTEFHAEPVKAAA